MKTTKKISVLLVLLSSVSFIPSAFADDIGDIVHYLSNISGADMDMDNLQKQYMPDLTSIKDLDTNIESYTNQQLQLLQDLTKAYGMGNLTTQHSFSQEEELWSPDSWDDALKMVSGGNSNRYNQLKEAYGSSNPVMKIGSTTTIDLADLVKNTYTLKSDTTNSVLAASQYSYEDVNKRIQALEELKAKIDDASVNKNEKAAMDLNSRINVELGLLQAEQLRLQSMQAQMQAVSSQEQINSDTADKQFMGYNINEQ